MADYLLELLIVRHGETDYNHTDTIQGQRNSQLTPFGLLQARLTAEYLKQEKFDGAFVSDLDRTRDTAKEILAYHPDIPVIYTEALREWKLGILEGQKYAEMTPQTRQLVDIMRSNENAPDIPGAETSAEFQKRVSDFMEYLATEHCGKRLLLVSHGGTMQRIFCHCVAPLATGNVRPLCNNTCVSIFRKRNDGRWQLVKWNDTSHLAALSQQQEQKTI